MIDAFAKSQGISLTTHHFKALFGEGLAPSICPQIDVFSLLFEWQILFFQSASG
jgi:hypothetical protein